jgi:hypothetical protein
MRIGVYTSDRRRLENAIVELDKLESLLKQFSKGPYKIDEYAIDKLLAACGNAARTQAVAASGAPTILDALRELRSEKARELESISLPNSAVTTIRLLMCQAMLQSIDREIAEWQRTSGGDA